MNKLFILCLITRFAFAYVAKNFLNILPYMGILSIFVAVGFSLIYLFNLRPTGIEAGGRIWWNSMRPVHATLYALFAYLALWGDANKAWMVLFADAVLGTLVFSAKYSQLMFQ